MRTTFYEDFSIAEAFGYSAVEDTFRRAFAEWKTNYKYLAELAIALNQKAWDWSEKGEQYEKYTDFYTESYYKAQDYGYDNFKGEALQYFFDRLD